MATRNIVPRATGEGQIGTSAKTWSAGYFNDIAVTNGVTASTFTGDLTGDVTGDLTGNVTGNVTGATSVAFTTQGEVGFRNTTHTEPTEVCKQVVVTAGTVDSEWVDGNAKLALHTYDSTGTNSAENGSFVLQADDGTNAPFLEGKPDGSLKWANHNVMTEKTETATVTAAAGTLVYGKLRKRGNIVELSFHVQGLSGASNTWVDALNVPAGFRPLSTFDFALCNNATGWSVQGKFDSAGVIKAWPAGGSITDVKGHVVYFV